MTTPLLRYTSDTTFTDVTDANATNSGTPAVVETPWLSFAGIQGFQRVYRLMALLRTMNGSTGTVSVTGAVYYDFSSTANTADAFVANFTPNASGVVQLEHHFVKQKCEAVKLQLTFSSAAARVRLTDLTLLVGVKFGYNKVPSSQRY